MLRHSLPHHDIGQRSDHLGARPAPFRTDQQTLARGLVDQVEDAHTTAILRSRTHEVVAPHVARMSRSEPHTRAVVEPQPSSWLLPLWNFQPFATPDAFDPVLAHPPAGTHQQRRDPAIPVTSILAGKSNDGLSQTILVFALCRPVALRAPWAAPIDGTHVAHSRHAHKRGSPHSAVARGLEVSRGDVLQHQIIQAQVRHQTLQLPVLLLKLLHPLRLVDLQPAILLAPAEICLLHDLRLLARLCSRLPVGYRHFDLSKQVHHLLWLIPLTSCHLALLVPVCLLVTGTNQAGHSTTWR